VQLRGAELAEVEVTVEVQLTVTSTNRRSRRSSHGKLQVVVAVKELELGLVSGVVQLELPSPPRKPI
jgi:hypothetical protein